jgi:SM-20-related protein
VPPAEFFTRFGLFVAPAFLNTEACDALRREVRATSGTPGRLWRAGSAEEVVDLQRKRRTEMETISPTAVALVEGPLRGVMPALARNFGVTLTGIEPPKFVVYQVGDFYQAHADWSEATAAPDYVKRRRITVVLFLNGQSESPALERYGGGS